MNNKIIIEVYVPQLETAYDVFIPINLTINDIIKLINKSISDLTGGNFIFNNQMRLYNRDTGLEVDYKNIVKDSGLKNGSKVILI